MNADVCFTRLRCRKSDEVMTHTGIEPVFHRYIMAYDKNSSRVEVPSATGLLFGICGSILTLAIPRAMQEKKIYCPFPGVSLSNMYCTNR
jgi:hypothetical protein